MLWTTRAIIDGNLGELVAIEGKKPTRKMELLELIHELENLKKTGISTVQLSGLGTLSAGGNILLSTESQI